MKEETTRIRLSIDLDAYPDVRDMLMDAIKATGEDKTSLTIKALKRQLPKVVRALYEERTQKMEDFLNKYEGANSGTESVDTGGTPAEVAAEVERIVSEGEKADAKLKPRARVSQGKAR